MEQFFDLAAPTSVARVRNEQCKRTAKPNEANIICCALLSILLSLEHQQHGVGIRVGKPALNHRIDNRPDTKVVSNKPDQRDTIIGEEDGRRHDKTQTAT